MRHIFVLFCFQSNIYIIRSYKKTYVFLYTYYELFCVPLPTPLFSLDLLPTRCIILGMKKDIKPHAIKDTPEPINVALQLLSIKIPTMYEPTTDPARPMHNAKQMLIAL